MSLLCSFLESVTTLVANDQVRSTWQPFVEDFSNGTDVRVEIGGDHHGWDDVGCPELRECAVADSTKAHRLRSSAPEQLILS